MVLDTSAFVGGFDPFTIGEEQYTTPKVETEMRDSMSALRFSTALESGKLKIVMPSPEFLKKVKTSATTVGDAFYLSETDMEILALALELKAAGNNPKIVTDDYSIQNVATQMGVEFVSLVTFGIRVRYCPACHRKYQANSKLTSCIVCGTELKRKPLRTENKVKRTT
jgi:UPF0271 protein